MSSERSISPEPLPRSHSHSSVALLDERAGNDHPRQSSSSIIQKRRRENPNRTPRRSRSPLSRSPSRSSVDGSKSPVGRRNDSSQHSPSPRQSSSSSKRRRHKESDADTGRRICSICSCDVEAAKRLFGVLDNCDHVFCYDCIVSWKRSKYSNAESESCPVCKVRSAFITPSKQWYETKEDKHQIVKKHKGHLKSLPCRYYLRHGFCRYSDRCFYDHHEAEKQYRQQNHHSRDRERDRDRDRDRERDHYRGGGGGGGSSGGGGGGSNYHPSHNGSRSHYQSPSPPPPPSSSSRYSSSRHRERAY